MNLIILAGLALLALWFLREVGRGRIDLPKLRRTAGWGLAGLATTMAFSGRIGLGLAAGIGAVALLGADAAQFARSLKAQLYSRLPGGAEHPQGDPNPRRGPVDVVMTEQEALEVLGLQPGAGADEITRAHRALLQKLHPDKGGTDWLAARINGAKDFLLRGHR